MARGRSTKSSNNSSANIGFEQKLWLAADKLRSNMDAAEYKHVVLGLIFLKYISDSFEEHHAKLIAGEGEYAGANPEDPDEYRAENIFWVPPAARWSYLQNSSEALQFVTKPSEPRCPRIFIRCIPEPQREGRRWWAAWRSGCARTG